MKKILVVNSDPDTIELLMSLLQLEGFEVNFVQVREDVAFMLEEFKPDLVLLDISRQTDLDEVHSKAISANIPVLLMTGHNTYPHTSEMGFTNFINKPFTMQLLMEKISAILQ